MGAYGYTLFVYKNDKLVEKIPYVGYSGHAMMDEVKYLRRSDYPREKGYNLEFSFGVEDEQTNG